MTRGRRFPSGVETAGVLLLGLAAIHVAMLPEGLAAERLPGPDFVFCLALAWTARRPRQAPLWALVALGLAADLFLMRPLGLGALALLLAAEVMRANAAALANGPFIAEWLAAAALAFATVLAMQAALELVFADAPSLRPLVAHAGATALAYPLAVLTLAALLGVRHAGRPRATARPGRLP